jgi:hypothetical protein
MADAARADVTSSTDFAMRHRSAQVTFQNCATCHTGWLASSATSGTSSALWRPGLFHAMLATQPGSCVDCHLVSEPKAASSTQSSWTYLFASSTASNQGQWMNHGSAWVVGQDCFLCHATNAGTTGSAWLKSTSFHAKVANPLTCQECHGLTNGKGAVAGTGNNLPAGLVNSTTITKASSPTTTGVAPGTFDQISHTDFNVAGRDCRLCHTQAGTSSVVGVAGKEWAQANFHANFTASNPLTLSPTTGRCSNCHYSLKPGPAFTTYNHASVSSTVGTQDCSSCHSYPGTGTSTPNWLGATGTPQYIAVGGFVIPNPPASTTGTIQLGIATLPHPTLSGTTTCASCHTGGIGGTGAIGYDHASTLINTNCSACHETGSNLLAPVWNGTTTQSGGVGDTRPFTLTALNPSICNGTTIPRTPGSASLLGYHYAPSDCSLCHTTPKGIATGKTGATYTSVWKFKHPPKTGSTNVQPCSICHNNGCN